MADKAKLNDMVDNMIGQSPEQAQIDFHEYLKTKFSDVIGGEPEGETNDSDNKDNEE